MVSEKAGPGRFRFRFTFLSVTAFLRRIWRDCDIHGFGKDFRALAKANGEFCLSCRCEKGEECGTKKGSQLGCLNKAVPLSQNPISHFLEDKEEKVPTFLARKEKSPHGTVGNVHVDQTGARRRYQTWRGTKYQQIWPVVCAYPAMCIVTWQ